MGVRGREGETDRIGREREKRKGGRDRNGYERDRIEREQKWSEGR